MATFYLQPLSDPQVVFEMSATTDVGVTVTSSTTNYPVENGSSFSDNIVLGPSTMTLQGMVTDVLQRVNKAADPFLNVDRALDKNLQYTDLTVGGTEYVEGYIRKLREFIKQRDLFQCVFSELLAPFSFGVITDFSISKTQSLGGDAWDVSITLQQVRIAKRADLDAEPSADYAELLAANKESNANPSAADDLMKELSGDNAGLFTELDNSPKGYKFRNLTQVKKDVGL